MRTLTCDSTAEIHSTGIRAFLDNMQSEQTRPIMEKYGLHTFSDDEWIPTHLMLDALNELSQHSGVTLNMVAIGMEIGASFPVPDDVDTRNMEEILTYWGDVYLDLNRNGDPGSIEVERVGPRHYATIHTDLFPDDFNYGALYGFARRFLPEDTFFTVQYDDETTPRDRGGDGPTIIHLEWE